MPDNSNIPADPEDMNADRAEWALEAVFCFMKQTGLTEEDGLETAVMDLLCDIAHLCDRRGLEFKNLLTSAAGHYNVETDPETIDEEDNDSGAEAAPETAGTQFDFLYWEGD